MRSVHADLKNVALQRPDWKRDFELSLLYPKSRLGLPIKEVGTAYRFCASYVRMVKQTYIRTSTTSVTSPVATEDYNLNEVM